MAPNNIFRDNATKYGTLGWSIFPLAAGAKVPLKDTDGFKSASANRQQHRVWSRAHPDANIAAATGAVSGIIVIDLDPRSGSDETLRKLADAGKRLPDTVTAVTPLARGQAVTS